MPKLCLFFPASFADENWQNCTFALEAPHQDEGRSWNGEWVLGRHPAADITLAVKSISRRHAAISYSYAADRWSVVDLASKTGTRVRHHLLEPGDPHPLVIGDRLWLGPNCVHIVEDEGDTLGDDVGEETVVDTKPLSHIPGAPPPPPPPAPPPAAPAPKTYADSAYLAVQWVMSPTTKLGAVYRLVLLALGAIVLVLITG